MCFFELDYIIIFNEEIYIKIKTNLNNKNIVNLKKNHKFIYQIIFLEGITFLYSRLGKNIF
jgi:hypothetical protein